MSFHVGQKVVCIEDMPKLIYGDVLIPSKGAIYTIRDGDDSRGVWLEEIRNEVRHCWNPVTGEQRIIEPSFWESSFRPLQERKTETGMAVLRKVADDASKRKNLITTV